MVKEDIIKVSNKCTKLYLIFVQIKKQRHPSNDMKQVLNL